MFMEDIAFAISSFVIFSFVISSFAIHLLSNAYIVKQIPQKPSF